MKNYTGLNLEWKLYIPPDLYVSLFTTIILPGAYSLIAISKEQNIPVKFVGVGEGIDDLQEFDPADFAKAIFENDEDEIPNEKLIRDSTQSAKEEN